MVVSKRCKVCTALDSDNIAISGGYCDKSLPDLVEKISGIKLDPRKANGVLICKLCAIQLVHTDVLIDKLRSTLQRLTKVMKATKPKTISKELPENEPKFKSSNKEKGNSIFLDNSLVKREEKELKQNVEASENLTIPTKNQDEPKINTPKEMVVRESVFQNNEKEILNGDAENNVVAREFKKVLDTEEKSKSFDSNSNEQNKEVEQKDKTSKKVLRRKSAIPKDNLTHHGIDLQQDGDQANISTTKFKKIADEEVTKPKAVKRKENAVECKSKNLNKSGICESTPVKRNKTVSISAFEENSIDLASDEDEITRSCNENSLAEVKMKILNCVICGKGFNQKVTLREHIESSHIGEKLKQCPNCSAEFRSQQKYKSHVFSEKCKHSKHACQYPKCNRRFKTAYKMELHMQEKHSSSQLESEVE